MIQEPTLPPKFAKETRRIALVVDTKWLAWIASWRRLQDIFPEPTLSDAVRTLVEKQLKAEGIAPPPDYPQPSIADDKPKKAEPIADKAKPKRKG